MIIVVRSEKGRKRSQHVCNEEQLHNGIKINKAKTELIVVVSNDKHEMQARLDKEFIGQVSNFQYPVIIIDDSGTQVTELNAVITTEHSSLYY